NKCVNIRHYKADEILKAMWIPPTGLENYIDIGYTHFKLLDRLATTNWNIKCLDAYIKQAPVANFEEIAGTYGDICTNKVPAEYHPKDDEIYPRSKLEIIPKIDSSKGSSVESQKYYISPQHPNSCAGCDICKNVTKEIIFFDSKKRLQAIKNNKKWQNYITKREFIERLNGDYEQHIKYQ
ncbi:MAG: hypothetical protein GY750_16880, partial [Lentisphaerae bacterium]|nr:hypothetical protein [Lentisphaerota bacterium]